MIAARLSELTAMFKLKRPCKTCPFRLGGGSGFQLSPERLDEIFDAPAFQCHNTVDYDNFDDPDKQQGEHPQQCVGLMVLLHREGRDNQIMQVASRLIGFDAGKLETGQCYRSIAEARAAHMGKEPERHDRKDKRRTGKTA